MSTSMKDLFARLEPGDLLQIPVSLPRNGEQEMAYAAVLRVGSERELYLSCLSPSQETSKACSCHNPLRWSDETNTLVDRDGDTPRWYSDGIHRSAGEAHKVAEIYARVPRVDQVRVNISEGDVKSFVNSPL